MRHGSKLVSRLTSSLFHRIGLKISSLICAIILFSMVSGSEDAQKSVFVDVISIQPPTASHRMLVSELPDKIKLTLKGSRSLIHSLASEDLNAIQIDLRDTRARYYYFDPDVFEIPAGLTVVQLVPASIPLRWERRVRVRVPIVPRFRAQTSVGSVGKQSIVKPAEIDIEGPEGEVHPVRSVQTDPIVTQGLRPGTYERWIRLEPLSSHTRYIGRPLIQVRFTIMPHRPKRVFKKIPVEILHRRGGVQLISKTVDVEVIGPEPFLGEIKREQISAHVRAGGERMRAVSVTLATSQPQIFEVRAHPEVVEIPPKNAHAPKKRP